MSLQSASIVVSYLQGDIGSFMLPQPYALPSQSFLGNSTNLLNYAQSISNFAIRTMFIERIFLGVFFLPSEMTFLTTRLF